MSVSKFDPELPLHSVRSPVAALQPGPCAMGPVAPGDGLKSMHVWLVQNTGAGVASATGSSHVQPNPQPQLPFSQRWTIRTGRDEGSLDFTPGEPVLAMAMALVERKVPGQGGNPETTVLEIQHWSQGVTVARERADPDA